VQHTGFLRALFAKRAIVVHATDRLGETALHRAAVAECDLQSQDCLVPVS
jgi:hypothetical protein